MLAWAPKRLLIGCLAARPIRLFVFDELCELLERLGLEKRVKGSHHVFRREGVSEMINLQRDGGNAKPYQVRQVRSVILNYRFGNIQ